MVLFFLFYSTLSHSEKGNLTPITSCEDVTWNDVVLLVQPYINDTIYTALVMQGLSSEYHPSAAARQVLDESLPEDVKVILKSIIEADC